MYRWRARTELGNQLTKEYSSPRKTGVKVDRTERVVSQRRVKIYLPRGLQ